MKSYYEKKKEQKDFNINNTEEIFPINIKIKNVFIQAFLEILYDYKNYLSVIGGKPIFNTNMLIEKRPKNDSTFYKEFTETQLFQLFIQNNTLNEPNKKQTFFEEQLEIYSKLKNKTDFREEYINNYNITCHIYKHYCIQLENIDEFDLNNKKKVYIKNELNINNYKRYINQKYFIYESYFRPNSIHKENKIVIKNKVIFDHSKIPFKYDFYIIPNQEFNFEVEKRKKSIRIKKNNTNSSQSNVNKKNELSPEEKEDIRENIYDILTKIFKNEEISDVEQDKKLIMDSLDTSYGRELYINVLYENSNISNEASFKFLNDIIYNSINKISKMKDKKKNLILIVKLFRCCNNFKMEENKKYIYLSDVFYPKCKNLEIFTQEFWEEWALLDISEEKNEKDMDQKWIKSLEKIESIMSKIGFNKTEIYSIVAELGQKNIKNEDTFSDYNKKLVCENLKIYHSK